MNERYLCFIERGGRWGDNAAYFSFIGNRAEAYREARGIKAGFPITNQEDFTEFIFWGL